MNRCTPSLAVILGLAVITHTERASTVSSPEIKSIQVPMPRGLVRAEAFDIVKDWTPPIVHLKGSVKVRIYTSAKDPRGAIMLQADAADLDQTTGQILPRGNVRLTVEDVK